MSNGHAKWEGLSPPQGRRLYCRNTTTPQVNFVSDLNGPVLVPSQLHDLRQTVSSIPSFRTQTHTTLGSDSMTVTGQGSAIWVSQDRAVGRNPYSLEFLFQQQQQSQYRAEQALLAAIVSSSGFYTLPEITNGIDYLQLAATQNTSTTALPRSHLNASAQALLRPAIASSLVAEMAPTQHSYFVANPVADMKRPQNQPYYYDNNRPLPDPSSDDEKDDEDLIRDSALERTDDLSEAAKEKFPFKLYRMLSEAEKNGHDEIVCFFPHGRAFTIHKPRSFVAEIMPKYFATTRMSSFQRQLNLYGFKRISEGRDKGGYYHEFFLQGRKSLCKMIHRKKKTLQTPPESTQEQRSQEAMVNPILTAIRSESDQDILDQLSQQILFQRQCLVPQWQHFPSLLVVNGTDNAETLRLVTAMAETEQRRLNLVSQSFQRQSLQSETSTNKIGLDVNQTSGQGPYEDSD